MPTFLYRCPVTGYRVQGRVADKETAPKPPEQENGTLYEPLACTICGRIHLVNPHTGRLLGQDGK